MDEKTISERKAHMASIQRIITRWENGEITMAAKREQIARENAFFYGRAKKSASTGESLTSVRESPGGHVPVARVPVPDPDPWGEDDDKEEWWQK